MGTCYRLCAATAAGHVEAVAGLVLLAGALLVIGWVLSIVYHRTSDDGGGQAAGELDALPGWDPAALRQLHDTDLPGGLRAWTAQQELDEALERQAETSEIAVVRALLLGADFRDGIDGQAARALDEVRALLEPGPAGEVPVAL